MKGAPHPNQPTLMGYGISGGVRDESHDDGGLLLSHWAELSEHVRAVGPAEIERRRDQARRERRDDAEGPEIAGVAAPPATELDPLPQVMRAEEWDALAAGIAQRARLLDAILSDIYGPQRLLR